MPDGVPAGLASIIGKHETTTLQDGQVITVRPFTIGEWDHMDLLEPGEMTGRQYMVLKLWTLLHTMPGWECEWLQWKAAVDGPAFEALRPVADAIQRVNASFRPRAST